MLDREPFLRAIFANPDDDLPRLVFADYLEEHDQGEWAELIRVQCALARTGPPADHPGQIEALRAREGELLARLGPYPEYSGQPDRGFIRAEWLLLDADQLANPEGFRHAACARFPEWYGATKLKVIAGRIVSPDPLMTIFTSPVTERVTELDLSGREVEIPQEVNGIRLFDVELKPVVTVPVVEALAKMREVRRLTALDLRNNDLDNDALFALANSPYFIRLERLAVSAGNRFRGRMWAKVRERFGVDVVE